MRREGEGRRREGEGKRREGEGKRRREKEVDGEALGGAVS